MKTTTTKKINSHPPIAPNSPDCFYEFEKTDSDGNPEISWRFCLFGEGCEISESKGAARFVIASTQRALWLDVAASLSKQIPIDRHMEALKFAEEWRIWGGGAKTKIAVKEIRITFMEGRFRGGFERKFKSFAEVNSWLYRAAADAPKGGAYDKTDFQVEYADGYVYKGRIDVHHQDERQETRSGTMSLNEKIKDHCEFYAGIWKPAHLTDEQHKALIERTNKATFVEFLENYSLQD